MKIKTKRNLFLSSLLLILLVALLIPVAESFGPDPGSLFGWLPGLNEETAAPAKESQAAGLTQNSGQDLLAGHAPADLAADLNVADPAEGIGFPSRQLPEAVVPDSVPAVSASSTPELQTAGDFFQAGNYSGAAASAAGSYDSLTGARSPVRGGAGGGYASGPSGSSSGSDAGSDPVSEDVALALNPDTRTPGGLPPAIGGGTGGERSRLDGTTPGSSPTIDRKGHGTDGPGADSGMGPGTGTSPSGGGFDLIDDLDLPLTGGGDALLPKGEVPAGLGGGPEASASAGVAQPTQAPEPATLALLGSGLAGIYLIARRRRNR